MYKYEKIDLSFGPQRNFDKKPVSVVFELGSRIETYVVKGEKRKFEGSPDVHRCVVHDEIL